MNFYKIVLTAFLFSRLILSQWNSNTSVNTLVCDTTGEQSVTKMALCPDGSTYYGWFDNRSGGYAVYIQRLDLNGNRTFPAPGILVSSNTQNSSLVDWDMIADNNNNVVLTFTDIRNGGSINPFAYMLNSSGAMLWGANGVTLSDSVNSFQPNPKVVQTTDGNYIFLWRIGSGPTKLAMQKLNSAGVKQWGAGPVLFTSGTTENYDWPSLVASDNGTVIIMFSGYTGTFINPSNYRIYTQKISTTGTKVWNSTQDTVYSLSQVSGFYQPRIFPDGTGGAIYCWRDNRNLTNLVTGYIQRKNSTGTLLFPVNGSPVSLQTGMNHFDPQAAFMPATGETVVFFYQSNSGQTQWGLSGQKFSSAGAQLWGSNGIVYIPLGNNQPGIYSAQTKDTNAFCYINESQFGSSNNLIKVFRTGKSGAFVWSGNILTASSILSSKVRLNSAVNSAGMSIVSWQDQRTDNGGIYAQNINFDGTFGTTVGITGISGNVPDKFSLDQNYPNPFNPETKIRFSVTGGIVAENRDVKLSVFNILGEEIKVLFTGKLKPGTYEYNFNASGYTSGVYFYTLRSNGFNETRKMILVK